jgi:cell division protein FtsB
MLIGFLVVALVWLQYRLWVGEGSLAEVSALQREIAQQREQLEQLRRRNAALQVEVDNLRSGLEAIEARARSELGMIKEGETFYQIVPAAPKP